MLINFVIVIVSLLVSCVKPQDDALQETQKCLDCICYGSSKCNVELGCRHNGGVEGNICGPFQMTELYWIDGGKPGTDFQSCALNRTCSEETVLNYMTRYSKDCDSDNEVTCYDFAKIHSAGPKQCDLPWIRLTRYWTGFLECMQGKRDARAKIEEADRKPQ